MKYLLIFISMILSLFAGAQTKVVKKAATKNNNFGVTYSLPKTMLIINAEVIKHTAKAGVFAKYAEKYLGTKNPVMEDKVFYQLGKTTIINKGVPDGENTYVVEFKSGTTSPFVFLTEDGRICTINAEYEMSPGDGNNVQENTRKAKPSTDKNPAFTEELLMAGSTAKQAEVAAKQIYRIRESRINILTGEADNLPPDGEAMKLVIQQLEQQENDLVSLFTGTAFEESTWYDVSITPYENLEKEVLFRFSDQLGIVDADDLSGAPVYINLKAIDSEPKPEPSNEKIKNEKGKEKAIKGIIYNIPGKATAEIYMNRRQLLKEEVQIAQFGRQETLASSVFEDKKNPVKVYFYPETGAIKQIIQ